MARYRKNQDKKRLYRGLGIAAAVLAAGILFVVVLLGAADRVSVGGSDKSEKQQKITYKGETYVPRGNLETYLIAGIDASGKVQNAKEYDGTGQCDVLVVIVRDRSTDMCQLLTIDRNTITAVKSLDDDGTYEATTDIQLSLAHSMGLDQKVRAENTVDAVSNLLGGQKIDMYAMVNMSAIQVVNDMVGGVTVTIEDDFSERDPSLKKGETVTLMGEHAENYVRGRMDVADGTNQNRIALQQQKQGGRFRYALSKIFIPYEVIKFHYPILQKHRFLTPVMEVRRWGKLIFCGHLKRTTKELQYNNHMLDTEVEKAQTLLRNIGL